MTLAPFFTWCDGNPKVFFFNWYYFFMILVAYLKASSLSLIPLVTCGMSLIFLKFIHIQWDKFELCAMLLSNNIFCIFMTSVVDTMVSTLSTILYVQVSLSTNIIVYLETYTYERGHLLCGILLSCKPPCLLSIILWWLQVWLVSACLISTHLWALTFCWRFFSSCSSREYVDFVA